MESDWQRTGGLEPVLQEGLYSASSAILTLFGLGSVAPVTPHRTGKPSRNESATGATCSQHTRAASSRVSNPSRIRPHGPVALSMERAVARVGGLVGDIKPSQRCRISHCTAHAFTTESLSHTHTCTLSTRPFACMCDRIRVEHGDRWTRSERRRVHFTGMMNAKLP